MDFNSHVVAVPMFKLSQIIAMESIFVFLVQIIQNYHYHYHYHYCYYYYHCYYDYDHEHFFKSLIKHIIKYNHIISL